MLPTALLTLLTLLPTALSHGHQVPISDDAGKNPFLNPPVP